MTGSIIDTETAAGNRRLASLAPDKRTVRVQDVNGQPINPCHPARARQLKRNHRVSLVCRHPFTIRLHAEHQTEAMQHLYFEDQTP
jgi:hypothetical protein